MLPETIYFVGRGHHGPENVESNWVYKDRYYWKSRFDAIARKHDLNDAEKIEYAAIVDLFCKIGK